MVDGGPIDQNGQNVDINGANDTIITINDSITSLNNQSSNLETDPSMFYETFSEPDNTVIDPDYVPNWDELNETTRLIRHKQLTNYAVKVSPNDLEPASVSDALSRSDASKWKLAMEDEMNSLDENRSWSLVNLPPGRKAVKSKWIFKPKRDQDGNIDRHKARLVAKGCSQRYGIDYEETYSPVVRHTSLRFLVAMAVKKNLQIDQMDAVTAFMQGELTDEIYLDQPEGFHDGTNRVCRLHRAINGLKQSGRVWNMKLVKTLKSFGLKQSKMDPCVFFTEQLDLAIGNWVDDIFIF